MSSKCILCRASDPFQLGLCASCAAGDDTRLLFLGRGTRIDSAVSAAGPLGIGRDAPARVQEALRGRIALLALPAAVAAHATAYFNAEDARAHTRARSELWREIPLAYWAMIAAILIAGFAAGFTTVPVMAWSTPLVAGVLLATARITVARPALVPAPSTASLPAPARAALTAALAELPSSSERALLLDLARVGEAALDAAPEAFRQADLGASIAGLVEAGSAAARESWHLHELASGPVRKADVGPTAQLTAARDHRLQQLEAAVKLLAEIGRQTVESPESASARIHALIDQVRGDAERRTAAQREVDRMLG